VERKGVEPSTSALRTRTHLVLSENPQELTAPAIPVCTSVCTNERQNDVSPALDAELQMVLDLWPKLSPAARSAIVAMVKATAKV
jgi:hypothetical protein